MNTATLSRPVSLRSPWPLRWLRAVERWLLAPRPVPHAVQIELSLHGLRDIGVPPEWHAQAWSPERFDEIERASLRMHGMQAPLGSLGRW